MKTNYLFVMAGLVALATACKENSTVIPATSSTYSSESKTELTNTIQRDSGIVNPKIVLPIKKQPIEQPVNNPDEKGGSLQAMPNLN